MGRARALSESLAVVENILGVDLRELSKTIAGNVTAKSNGDPSKSRPAPSPGESVTPK
jgi:hypothetical protein